MSDEGSDIEIQSALPKPTNKKMPTSPSDDLLKRKQSDPKKLTTKIMINQALIDLKSRKGVSLQAIKKYITEKYSIDTDKINFYIKKYLKSAVEKGSIVQVKGVGASGSFKLVQEKEKKPKQKKKVAKEKTDKKNPEKTKKLKEKTKKTVEKAVKTKTKLKENKEEKLTKPKMQKVMVEKVPKEKKNAKEKKEKKEVEKEKKVRIAKGMQTPSKKKAMMKRKSIGSIIKPPKMKPKPKA